MSQSKLLQALELWRSITGIDPEASSCTIGSWELRETFRELQEAIDLDPTEITAHLLLQFFLNSYLEDREVSLLTLLNDPKGVAARLEKPRLLMELLNTPGLLAERDAFIASITKAMEQYGAAQRPDVQKLLASHDSIALLRRDALRGIEKLRVDQFLEGTPEPAGVVPVFNQTVWQFWSMPNLLRAATLMPSGVSLCLVRDPTGWSSFFAFVIRNGGNVFVLSDTPEYAHPLQGSMSRRPDRDLQRRASRNWFPYDLMQLEYTEDGKRMFFKATRERSLVAYQPEALPLKAFSELEPECLVWASLMMELIVSKFWHKGWRAPQLSYTAEMLRIPGALIEHAKTANLPVPAYQPVGLPALRKEDVAWNAVTEAQVGTMGYSVNRWMEERYSPRVPDEVLNLVAMPETMHLLDRKTGQIAGVSEGFHRLTSWDQEAEIAKRIKLTAVDSTSFGSRERLEADRKFIARVNLARHVGALAADEFAAREDEVKQWYRARVRANASTILSWCGNEAVWVDEGLHDTFTRHVGNVGGVRIMDVPGQPDHRGKRRVLRQFLKRHEVGAWEQRWNASGVVLGEVNARDKLLCHVDGTTATYFVGLYPGTPDELALVAGCAVAELPDVLQHHHLLEPYVTNVILNRADPMEWKVKNPWLSLKLSVLIPLSRRALARLEKTPVVIPDLPGRMVGEAP